MHIDILDACNHTKQWCVVLDKFPRHLRDIYFSPEWVKLHRFDPSTRAIMFVCQDGSKIWIYPFLLGSISHVGDHRLGKTWRDIQTPYGYGGPLSNTQDAGFVTQAWSKFSSWCQDVDVVAEFVRLHPIIQNEQWLDPDVRVMYDMHTVSLDFEELQYDKLPFNANTRNMLTRANKLGVRVSKSLDRESFDQFVVMYGSAMKRLEADEYLHFTQNYFQDLYKLVQDNGFLLLAEHETELIAAAIFLKGSNYLHYHLASSNPDRMVSGANNQLLFHASNIGYKYGLKGLHLGGGRTTDPKDTLLRFKQSMSTHTHRYLIGKRIYKPKIYTSLRDLWRQYYPSLIPRYGDRLLCYRYGS